MKISEKIVSKGITFFKLGNGMKGVTLDTSTVAISATTTVKIVDIPSGYEPQSNANNQYGFVGAGNNIPRLLGVNKTELIAWPCNTTSESGAFGTLFYY